MFRYCAVSVVAGLLFAAMDAAVNTNAHARKLFAIYQPIARTSINVPAGVAIDLAYGFVMAGLFLLLYRSLPGNGGLAKGVSLAAIAWFFRVAMSAASSWMMFDLPATTVAYALVTGLAEMLVLGILLGMALP